MKNYEVFTDYDMVVAISQQTINDQLTHLTHMGIIQSALRITRDQDDDGNFLYKCLGPSDVIPPDVESIDAFALSQIDIQASGGTVHLELHFQSGTFTLWKGRGRAAKLAGTDMSGWVYSIAINMDLNAVKADDLLKNKKVPDSVLQQLTNFNTNMFDINHLFMDFESTDLIRFDPQSTQTGAAGDDAQSNLAEFMQFYLSDLIKSGNPYILGYSLTTNDATQYAKDQMVPDTLRPVSTTYNMFHETDASKQGRNTLNFILGTKGGHGVVQGSPGVFDTNWLPSADSQACMAYSRSVLMEANLLKPFYDSFSKQIGDSIKDQITIAATPTYAEATKATATGYSFTISDVSSGSDQYVNTYTVDFSNSDGAVTLNFKGHLYFYKYVQNEPSEAHASGTIDWSGTYTLSLDKTKAGDPQLVLTHSYKIDNQTSDSSMNTAAKALSWIGKIIGGVLDLFTAFQDHNYIGNALASLMSVSVPGIGDVSVALGSLGDSVGPAILLPAGQVFFFKSPSADPYGNLTMDLTYKSQS